MSSSQPRSERLEHWLALVMLAGAVVQAVARHDAVATDGVSYFDLADRLRDSDWTAALDRYWSPLYPVLLAGAGTIARGTRATEASIAHVLHVLLFAVALLAFRGAVRAVRDAQERVGANWLLDTRTPIGTAILYAAFACGALRYTNVGLVTPDLIVLTVSCAVVAMLLRAEARGPRADIAFGALLALGYFAKAAMLPIGLVALGAWALVRRPPRLRSAWRAAATLGILIAPYVALLSAEEGKVTTGETGPINLAWYVGGVSSQVPDPTAIGTESLASPWLRIVQSPATYAFPGGTGTYPAWADPARWQRGIHFAPRGGALVASIRRQLADYYVLIGVLALAATALAAAYGGDAPWRVPLAIAVFALAPVMMYLLVHVEPRFLGGSVIAATLALALACGRVRPRAPGLLGGACLLVATLVFIWPVAIPSLRESLVAAGISSLMVLSWSRGSAPVGAGARLGHLLALFALVAPVGAHVVRDVQSAVAVARGRVVDVDAAVAQALNDAGAGPGSGVGSVGASTPAAWARRGSVHIVAEVAIRDVDAFWRSDGATQAVVIRAMRRAGATAIVARTVMPPGTGWRAVPATDYWLLPASTPPSR